MKAQFFWMIITCENNANVFFGFFYGDMVQYLRLSEGFEPQTSNVKDWEFLSTVAASWNYRFLGQIRKCVTFQSNRNRRSAFFVTVFDHIRYHYTSLTNCSLGWTTNRPPIAQVVAEDFAVKNAKSQIDWQWPKAWFRVSSFSKIENHYLPSKKMKLPIDHRFRRTISVENKFVSSTAISHWFR